LILGLKYVWRLSKIITKGLGINPMREKRENGGKKRKKIENDRKNRVSAIYK
jgi:hypothetical protein